MSIRHVNYSKKSDNKQYSGRVNKIIAKINGYNPDIQCGLFDFCTKDEFKKQRIAQDHYFKAVLRIETRKNHTCRYIPLHVVSTPRDAQTTYVCGHNDNAATGTDDDSGGSGDGDPDPARSISTLPDYSRLLPVRRWAA